MVKNKKGDPFHLTSKSLLTNGAPPEYKARRTAWSFNCETVTDGRGPHGIVSPTVMKCLVRNMKATLRSVRGPPKKNAMPVLPHIPSTALPSAAAVGASGPPQVTAASAADSNQPFKGPEDAVANGLFQPTSTP